MPVLETQEKVDKAIAALKDYHSAQKAFNKAASVVQDKLTVLKTITGITGNNNLLIEDEVMKMLGQVYVHGIPETR